MPKRTKLLIQWLLGAILLADVVLVGINWEFAAAPHTARADLNVAKAKHARLAVDVARAEKIRRDLPAITKQCNTFYLQNLPPAESGYSQLLSNLRSLASDAGIRDDVTKFSADTPDKRGVIRVEIATTVNGDYPGVVRFINGLEHSDTFYVLDGLSLAADEAGQLKLDLQLRTYFRS